MPSPCRMAPAASAAIRPPKGAPRSCGADWGAFEEPAGQPGGQAAGAVVGQGKGFGEGLLGHVA